MEKWKGKRIPEFSTGTNKSKCRIHRFDSNPNRDEETVLRFSSFYRDFNVIGEEEVEEGFLCLCLSLCLCLDEMGNCKIEEKKLGFLR